MSLNAYCTRLLEAHAGPASFARSTPVTEQPAWLRSLDKILNGSIVGVVLFGSVARGEERVGSDIDMLIVLQPDTVLSRQLYDRWDQLGAGPSLSPHFVHLPSQVEDVGSLWLEAAIDGIVLLDQDLRIAKVLGKVRREIARGRFERGMAHGHPYWKRNEGAGHAQRVAGG